MLFRRYPNKKKRQPKAKVKREQYRSEGRRRLIPELIVGVSLFALIVISLALDPFVVPVTAFTHYETGKWRLAFDYPQNWRIIGYGTENSNLRSFASRSGRWTFRVLRGTPQALVDGQNTHIYSTDPVEAIRMFSSAMNYALIESSDDFAWPAWVGYGNDGARMYILAVNDEWVVCGGYYKGIQSQRNKINDASIIDTICRSLDVQP